MNIITPYELSRISVAKILIYLRKSRSEGKETVEEVLSRHEKILQEFAVQTWGEQIPEINIHREVVSGETITEREEIQKVFKRIEDEGIEVLLVIEPQRISRGDMLDCGRVVNILKYSNTLVATITKTYDLNNKFDKEIFESQLLQGNKYLEYQKEIMDRGRQLSLREGKFLGSIPPYGYVREALSKGFKLTKHPEESKIVEMIFNMTIKENKSAMEIAKYLNANEVPTRTGIRWVRAAITSILRHEVYYGAIRWGRDKVQKKSIGGEIVKIRKKGKDYTLINGLHEAIVSKEDWDLAQEIVTGRTAPRVRKNGDLKNPLAGLIKCGACGYAIIISDNRPPQSARRKRVRRYELDVEKLNKTLKEARESKGIPLVKMSEDLGIKYHHVANWCSRKIEKTYYSHEFNRMWPVIKLYLGIDTDEFDAAIISADDPKELDKMLRCSDLTCSTKRSMYSKVENMILDDLKKVLKEFKYYVDNYEEEIVIERSNNDKAIAKINKKIESLKEERKNLLRAWNRKEYEYEDYRDLRDDIENEIQIAMNDLETLETSEKNDTLSRYKKGIPMLENCLNEYHNLSTTEKNEVLKSIIDKVIYTKNTSKHHSSTGMDDTKIITYLKI